MASIPQDCTVLVVGGGPGGSYTASVLAREGIDTVLLEADVFPRQVHVADIKHCRYHIGESMLASFRHFLRFIDLDSTFVQHGFTKKVGAAFKLNGKREGFTDFVASGGPENYTWNVIRSESDELMFRHAGKSGAKIFDGVKVSEVNFQPPDNQTGPTDLGRPISASWQHKDGSSGAIKFRYLVDASGRAGLICNKYLKNRKFNQGLKNVASWGYWKGNSQYAAGTARESSPFFESLRDGSGWCWAIPLHNGTMSVGVVMNQALSISKKKGMESPSSTGFYKESLKLVPDVLELLKNAELISDIKSASDWSYSASSYASPYLRIVGDAGCFIDPYFSSGVHLALSSALSAAVTICAAERGQCTELAAGDWHSKKVKEGYTRFLLVVLSALKQIMERDEPVLSDWDEDGFDRAFAIFRPIIQGTADVNTKLTQSEVSKTVEFCLNAFSDKVPDDQVSVMRKVGLTADTSKATPGTANGHGTCRDEVILKTLTPDELLLLKNIRARQMLRMEDRLHIDNFAKDSIDGFVPYLERGNLGLVSPVE